MSLSPAKQKFVDCASEIYGEGAILDREMINNVCDINHLPSPSWFPRSTYSVGRGQFKLPVEGDVKTPCKSHQITPAVLAEKAAEIPATAANLMMVTDIENMVPERFNGFVPWGHFRDIKNIICLLYTSPSPRDRG